MAGMRNARETTWARAQAMDGALSGGRVGVEEVAAAAPRALLWRSRSTKAAAFPARPCAAAREADAADDQAGH
jgi:hypothetical protein